MLPLSCNPLKSSRFIHSSQPSGTPGGAQRWMGVGRRPSENLCSGACTSLYRRHSRGQKSCEGNNSGEAFQRHNSSHWYGECISCNHARSKGSSQLATVLCHTVFVAVGCTPSCDLEAIVEGHSIPTRAALACLVFAYLDGSVSIEVAQR